MAAKIGSLALHGLPAWFTWLFLHIAYLIDFRNRLVVMSEWAWVHLADQWEARLVLCDIEPDSRTLDAAAMSPRLKIRVRN